MRQRFGAPQGRLGRMPWERGVRLVKRITWAEVGVVGALPAHGLWATAEPGMWAGGGEGVWAEMIPDGHSGLGDGGQSVGAMFVEDSVPFATYVSALALGAVVLDGVRCSGRSSARGAPDNEQS